MKATSYETTSVQALNESKIDNAKLSNIVENRREAKREMKHNAATKRVFEDPTRNYTDSFATNELVVKSQQKPLPNYHIDRKRINPFQSKLSFCLAPKTFKAPISVFDSLFKQKSPKNSMKEATEEV